ncbi:hypothetical protein T01_3615 [Trichinella spiralis]|uniref:Uncharacterized protein n=1 Tax=Trichinella spiralis TaxID=6334 RepID=A0A0V1BDP2_TRISP|nr:hypothetical protein T01_3615 [Trichinella spiralis]
MVLHCLVCARAYLMVAFDFDMSNQYCRPLWQSEYAQILQQIIMMMFILMDKINRLALAELMRFHLPPRSC